MNSKKSRGVRFSAPLVLALVLVGCTTTTHSGSSAYLQEQQAQGEPADAALQAQVRALDDYVAAEQSTIPTIMAGSNGVYSDVIIGAIYPDTVDYSYHYAQPVDPGAARSAFDSHVQTFQDSCDTLVFPAMKRAGVTSSQGAKYTYYNTDGSEIWSQSFTSSD
ncbi:MAG: hypothetical protein QOF36_2320 [Microbacteriaceae bacterium]|nr:hypothetical protein [Microbacteriaceae bacterium]